MREVVAAIMSLMGTPAAQGQVFNIGSDKPWSIRQLAEAVIAKVDPAVRIEHLPYSKAYGDDFEDVRRRVPDVSRLKQTIGSSPQLGLETILDDIIAWKRSQKTADAN